jgi:superfamily I DNA and RNA helicase
MYLDPAMLAAGMSGGADRGRSQNAPTDGEATSGGESGRPSDVPTDEASVSLDREVVALRLALDHLVDAEGILPEDILVITCRSQRRSRWYTVEHRQVGAHRLIQRPEGGRPGRVALSTVRSAKGLERKVIVLTELDGLDGAAKRDTLLYVALSRAVHHLVVLGPEKAMQPTGRKAKSGILAGLRAAKR